ncbi:MAG TPA: VOC family protein [Prolixibacteraceae bacterium]|jgi:catechol 2,3-dioxygenase-like lactoylglutathione lyase family enzyme|nr:VOC family protein [Prolixibacteraceae bacterium]HPJ78872.1 VOC family protein [Prolixibacteraceae bacterium]HRV90098.1 VOC family protein [Prolixibacteraceae bacterium]
MKYKCPLLVVSDIQRSRSFYEDLLGLKVIVDFGENITFQGDFAIHLKSHYQKLIDNKEIQHGGNNFEIYFEEDDLEGIVQLLKGNGITFVHELREQPWKQRVVRFYDPDHHIIEVGESMENTVFRLHNEGWSVDEISVSTLMPPQFVEQAIVSHKKQ